MIRQIKWFIQRRIRGFDDRELWSLDHSLSLWLLPRLKAFRDKGPLGTPSTLIQQNRTDDDSYQAWLSILDDMIFMFEKHIEDCSWYEFESISGSAENSERYKRGVEAFSKYWRCLWD